MLFRLGTGADNQLGSRDDIDLDDEHLHYWIQIRPLLQHDEGVGMGREEFIVDVAVK